MNKPAFPRSSSEQQPGDRRESCYAQEGMTLREWYAGQALQGILAATPEEDAWPRPQSAAADAFAYADAMIAQSKEKT